MLLPLPLMAWPWGLNAVTWERAWCAAPLPHLCNLFPPTSPPPPASAVSRGPDSDPAARGRPRVGRFLSGVQFLYFMKRTALWIERPKAGKVVISDLQAVLQEVEAQSRLRHRLKQGCAPYVPTC